VGADQARLFVALELPPVVRAALAEWGSGVAADIVVGGLRPVRRESLHVTLCFLGTQPVSRVAEIAAACRVVARFPAVRLAAGEPVWLPRRRPRVLAIGLGDETGNGPGRLAEVQSSVAAALQAGGFYQPEPRPFLGHVTVARVAARTRLAPTGLLGPAVPSFTADRVTVYRSLLGSGPARYEAFETVVRGAGAA
jgi:RNA 2',3'-cyclic 3'-phosphodiesterase